MVENLRSIENRKASLPSRTQFCDKILCSEHVLPKSRFENPYCVTTDNTSGEQWRIMTKLGKKLLNHMERVKECY